VLEEVADRALASEFEPVACLEAPEPAEVPASLRRADGRSVCQRHGRVRFATRAQLTMEQRMLALARASGAPRLDRAALGRADGPDIRGMPVGRLLHLRDTYPIETAWAPPWVGDKLRQVRAAARETRLAGLRASAEAAAARQRGAHDSAARQQELTASYQALHEAYRQRETVFAATMADRADWDAATRAQRQLAVAADAELRRRHPDQHYPGVGGDHLQLVSGHDSSVPRRRRECEAIGWTAERQATPGCAGCHRLEAASAASGDGSSAGSHTSARFAGSGEKELQERYSVRFRTGTRECGEESRREKAAGQTGVLEGRSEGPRGAKVGANAGRRRATQSDGRRHYCS
jgi:hypothetical protein